MTSTSDVFGRSLVTADRAISFAFVSGRRVLVTGAAGSIGRELVRQVAQLNPVLILGLDTNESDLYDFAYEVTTIPGAAEFRPVVASVTNHATVQSLLRRSQVDIVFHAAAYKHVPLMEEYPAEAVTVNTIATYHIARAAAAAGVSRFVLVSTDKAVRPTSVMGATKRLAELLVRSVSVETGLSACAVRLGNVLASRGSVIPLFEKQIAAGGPITITHPDMKRYFMSIAEAADLIIQAGAFGDDHVIYMLDMGEEVAIRDIAEDLIRRHGLRPDEDIRITYTGARPGEKLSESLSRDYEFARPTPHPKIRILREGDDASARGYEPSRILAWLGAVCADEEPENVRAAVHHAISIVDHPANVPHPKSLGK
jgi:FlaA1/EpsC-like NDP-sugar epimerase